LTQWIVNPIVVPPLGVQLGFLHPSALLYDSVFAANHNRAPTYAKPMSSLDKASRKPFISVQLIVLIEIIWGVLALLFFLLFSAGEQRPAWYSPGTSVFEAVAHVLAAVLCFRNWRSPQIVSGRSVWLNLGLGLLFYFLGTLLFSYWELGLGIEPAVSPGDFCYIVSYIFLLIGMAQAVFSRRLNLELWQKGVVVAVALIGVAFAVALAGAKSSTAPQAHHWGIAPAYAQTAPANPNVAKPPGQSPGAQPAAQPIPTQSAQAPAQATEKPAPPEWASSLEKQLQPLEPYVTLFYTICDVVLLVLATTLLLAFWGGRFSQSWRMIAAAAFCLYIADMWFKFATATNENYQSGSLLEVFWVFSSVLFGIGAALEYDLSSRSRRASSRRRA
jgi:flagellar basal body-associated protein FliL